VKKYKDTCGVYAVVHVPSGCAYIGGTVNVGKRWSNHRFWLRDGNHGCKVLQLVWNDTRECDWDLILLEECSRDELRTREQWHMDNCLGFVLNVVQADGTGKKHSEAAKEKQRIGRARFLKDNPEAHKSLSDRAKAQHATGNLGKNTWKEDTVRAWNPKSGVAGARALKRLSKDPVWVKERARRAALARRYVYVHWTGERVLMKRYRQELDV